MEIRLIDFEPYQGRSVIRGSLTIELSFPGPVCLKLTNVIYGVKDKERFLISPSRRVGTDRVRYFQFTEKAVWDRVQDEIIRQIDELDKGKVFPEMR